MPQNTSNAQRHGDTIRSRRLLDGIAQDDSNSSRKHSQHTHHKHKAALNDSTEHYLDKSEHSSYNLRTTTAYISQANIPSCRGWSSMQPTFSTGTQYTQTATPATTEGKQYPTCYQQQSTGPRWKHASFRPSGLAKTPQQMRTVLESPNRLSKQGQSGDKRNQRSTTSRWWTSSTPHRWQHQHRRASSCYQQDLQSATNRKHLQQSHRHSKRRNYQFCEAVNRHPRQQSQTYQWQRHQQHTTDEHPCQSQQQQNRSGRWHRRSQFSKATTDGTTTHGSTEAGSNARTRQDPTPSVGGYCHNKTWRQGQSSLQRRPTRINNGNSPTSPSVRRKIKNKETKKTNQKKKSKIGPNGKIKNKK